MRWLHDKNILKYFFLSIQNKERIEKTSEIIFKMFITHYIEFHSPGRKSNSVISEYCSFYLFTNTFQSVDYYFSTAVNCTVISTPCISPYTTVIFKLWLLGLSCSFVVWCGIYFHLCIYSCMSVRILYLCITNLFLQNFRLLFLVVMNFTTKNYFHYWNVLWQIYNFFPIFALYIWLLSLFVLYFLKKLRYLTSPSVFSILTIIFLLCFCTASFFSHIFFTPLYFSSMLRNIIVHAFFSANVSYLWI